MQSPPPTDLLKLACVYNQYTLDLVMDIKELDGASAKLILKKSGNRTIDPTSHKYLCHGVSTIRDTRIELLKAYKEDIIDKRFPFPSNNETVRRFEFMPGVLTGSVLDIADANASDEDKAKVHMYIHVLITLCVAHMECNDSRDSAALAEAVLARIAALQNSSDQPACSSAQIVIDDDIDILLVRMNDMMEMMKKEEEEAEEECEASRRNDMSAMLGDSKIADLANEVAADIDISKLLRDVGQEPGGDGSQPFDFSKITQNTNLIGEIVSNVGSKIQSKLASGELNQQDLMKEALSLMASFNGASGSGGMGGFGDIINAATSAGGGIQKRKKSRKQGGSAGGEGIDMGNMMADIFKTMSGLQIPK